MPLQHLQLPPPVPQPANAAPPNRVAVGQALDTLSQEVPHMANVVDICSAPVHLWLIVCGRMSKPNSRAF
jgi:hypothetical protein